jgi:release factor glutamine methyltransferase
MPSALLSSITTCLASLSDTPALDASVLLAHITSKPRTWILAHPELTLTPEQQIQLDDALQQLERGKPFPYVLGHWEFFGLEFDLTPDVLIPRPETELLVEKAIAWLKNHPDKNNIADVGTGSGAIAVSLAKNLPNAHILATDISAKALDVATRNAEKHGVNKQINFVECDLLPHPQPLSQWEMGVNLLCANLPYIPTTTLQTLSVFQHEPTLALDGGSTGFEVIERLLRIASTHLAPRALLLFEIEATLGEQALKLGKQYFPSASLTLHQDLTGRDRLLQIQT